MAELARRRREDAVRLKARLEPHTDVINRMQAILLWLDTPGQVQFVIVCVVTHILLGLAAHLIEGVTLPAMLPYGFGLYLLARYTVEAAPIPWQSIFSVGATGVRVPYTLDDIVQAAVATKHFVLTVVYELGRLKDINYARYTAQLCTISFVVGLILNHVSGYTFIYMLVYALLLVPGIYTHGVFGRLWSMANSHPQVGRAMDVARQHYTKLASNFVPKRVSTPQQQVPAGTSSQPPTGVQPASTSASTPSTTVAEAVDPDADDFVQIPSDKKHD